LAASAGHRDSLAVRLQQSWARVAFALLVVCGLCGATYVWGIPLAGQMVTTLVPLEVDRQLGEAAMVQLDQHWMRPSRIPLVEQERLRVLARRAIAKTFQQGGQATTELDITFRDAGRVANAMALPGGRIVVTDALVELAAGRDDIFVGVLGHEAGHVLHRHSMRMIVQASLVGAGAALLFGDIGSWLAAAPAMLGELAYSRDLERQADAASLAVLQANALGGQAMVDFFDLLAKPVSDVGSPTGAASAGGKRASQRDDGAPADTARRDRLAAILSTHPVDAERIAYFRAHR
jgi:predicted Zn-dependent protease